MTKPQVTAPRGVLGTGSPDGGKNVVLDALLAAAGGNGTRAPPAAEGANRPCTAPGVVGAGSPEGSALKAVDAHGGVFGARGPLAVQS
jgi:hypothetical protein